MSRSRSDQHRFSLAFLHLSSSRKLTAVSGVLFRNCSDEKYLTVSELDQNDRLLQGRKFRKKSKKCHVIGSLDTVNLMHEKPTEGLSKACL